MSLNVPKGVDPKVFLYYDIRPDGSVVSVRRGKVIKSCIKKTGYKQVVLNVDGVSYSLLVHRLVALKFIPKSDGCGEYVNHKDGNRANNSVDNLEWCTMQKNTQRKIASNKISEGDEVKIRTLHSEGKSQTLLAKEFGVNQSHISRIVNFKSRK